MALTKIEIAENLVERLGLDKRVAKQLVEQFFEEIRTTLEKGEEVKLSGFGNFTVREKRPRPGRNPKTGEDVVVSARRVVTFKAGQKMRERVENAKVKA
ncbi:MAG: integration host factor subunit alpha [Pasteurellaceae bacterium]|nr:integration host factor subunit alpha [Pasteurellaceae bacterium]